MIDSPLFEIDDLHVSTSTTDTRSEPRVEILNGVSLTVNPGEIHAVMGPNRSGKSTLAAALLGSRGYEVTSGRIVFRGDDITDWDTDVRAKAGLFLAFQHPQAISGVSVLSFLRQALSARQIDEMSVVELRLTLTEWMEKLSMDPAFLDRHLNEGFSGAERRRHEILQMAVLEPDMAILDEIDADLDIDALNTVADGIRAVKNERPELGTLVITRHRRLLEHLEPDAVHILGDGRIVASGGMELAEQLEPEGYGNFT